MPDNQPDNAEKQSPELPPNEQQEVEERSAASVHVVHEVIVQEGEEEIARPSSALAWSGLAAGLSMGFSMMTEGLIRRYVPQAEWATLLYRLGYPIGFLVVVLGRQQLFTENTLTAILPVLDRRTWGRLAHAMRVWLIVLVTNLVGALVFAAVAGNTPIFKVEVKAAFAEIGRAAAEGSFGTILLRGIFAGWLIALMVWLLPSARGARLWVILIITYIVGLGGLSHVIAGSVEVLYLVCTGALAWYSYLGGYLVPTLVGNIIGGVALVAVLNHAQTIAGRSEEKSERKRSA